MKDISKIITKYITDETGDLIFHVEKDTKLILFDIALDDAIINRSVTVFLDGCEASVIINGLFFGNEAQNFSISHTVRHLASHTNSSILTNGALSGDAKTTYKGLIKIANGTIGCSGEQAEHTLLLSDRVHIEAVPSLEIGNNDVKATHSVSTTYIDDIKKFYLESRGLSEDEAIRQIVQGHFSYILDRIQNKEVKKQTEMAILNKLHINF